MAADCSLGHSTHEGIFQLFQASEQMYFPTHVAEAVSLLFYLFYRTKQHTKEKKKQQLCTLLCFNLNNTQTLSLTLNPTVKFKHKKLQILQFQPHKDKKTY